jgi:hypothetical protein
LEYHEDAEEEVIDDIDDFDATGARDDSSISMTEVATEAC